MIKQIILITNTFPYSPGEEFLETEIKYWAQQDDIDFIIMPKRMTNDLRELPTNISIDHTLLDMPIEQINKVNMALQILVSGTFYKEVYRNVLSNPKRLKYTLTACRDLLHYRGLLKKYLQKHKSQEILFYSYWHTEVCYASQFLKSEFDNIKVVSRIHRYDLYQEHREYSYMPLKKQFTKSIDKVFTISEEGTDYLLDTYGFDTATVEVSRLGVEDYAIDTKISKTDHCNIASCSYVSKVKRIDKIIDALVILADSNPNMTYQWTHIGNGNLYEQTLQMAKDKLSRFANIHYIFKGHMTNQEVYQFYKNSNIDVFINVSESEGVPVTIMEAMSCYIPIVAPDVGAISDMVKNGFNGYLLSSACKVKEIVDALTNIEFYKDTGVKRNAYEVFLDKYNAEKNYNTFISNLYTMDK